MRNTIPWTSSHCILSSSTHSDASTALLNLLHRSFSADCIALFQQTASLFFSRLHRSFSADCIALFQQAASLFFSRLHRSFSGKELASFQRRRSFHSVRWRSFVSIFTAHCGQLHSLQPQQLLEPFGCQPTVYSAFGQNLDSKM